MIIACLCMAASCNSCICTKLAIAMVSLGTIGQDGHVQHLRQGREHIQLHLLIGYVALHKLVLM